MTSRAAALQSINQSLVDQTNYQNSVLNAAFTGGTDTACLRFNVAAVGTTFAVEIGTLAANGTVISISQAGVYLVELVASQTGAVTNVWGLSLAATAAPLVAVPAFGAGGCFQAAPQVSLAASTVSVPLVGTVVMRTIAAKATAGLTATNNLRGLAAASGGGAPTGVVAANVSLRIQQINATSM
jgi:hypothetical protein